MTRIKPVFFFTLSLLFVMACSSSDDSEPVTVPEAETPMEPDPEPEPEPDPDPDATEWNLVLEEQFDNDLESWNVWSSGAFNEEIQLYRPEQAVLEEGILTITAEREAVQGPTDPFTPTLKDFEYASARLETKDQFGPSDVDGERQYRFAARIKLPSGNGMWPAFWSFGDDWPTNGEIDILEARGNEPMVFQSNIFYGTESLQPLNDNADTSKKHEPNLDLTADFHEYELIWKADSLDIVFDGETVHTYTADDKNFVAELFGKKQRVVLNLAVGGVFFQDGNSANYADEATMQVDWVRVYKR